MAQTPVVGSRAVRATVGRPARGFHRYKNGFLNVATKGIEKDLVHVNQQSPLLRLPRELRNQIWIYALGGTIFRGRGYPYTESSKFVAGDPSVGPTLLQTCRQIYSEIATLPFRFNVFSVGKLNCIRSGFRTIKSHQRKCVRFIQIEVEDPIAAVSAVGRKWAFLAELFPAAERVEIIVYDHIYSRYAGLGVRSMRKNILPVLGDKLVITELEEVRGIRRT